jgi:acyl carrier protein
MTMSELKAAIAVMVSEGCGLARKSVQMDRPLVEYGLDSVRAIDLLISIEEHFGISIPDESARYLRTVNDIAAYLQERMETRMAA